MERLGGHPVKGRMAGRSSVVTGAGSGIGRATALRLADEGASVVALDVDAATVAETAAIGGDLITPLVADVSDRDGWCHAIACAVERSGRLDTLVNNAAVSIPGIFHELPLSAIERTLAVNVVGVFHGCQLAVSHMLKHGGGTIVNIASVNALVAERYLSVYAASKGAVVMMTRGIALDYAKNGIRANVICPGWVDTPFNHAHAELLGGMDRVYDSIDSFQPIGRPGTPAEIAAVATFLASDDSSFLTGSVIVADGGMTLQ